MLSTDRRKWLENLPRSIVGVEMERRNHQKNGSGLRDKIVPFFSELTKDCARKIEHFLERINHQKG